VASLVEERPRDRVGTRHACMTEPVCPALTCRTTNMRVFSNQSEDRSFSQHARKRPNPYQRSNSPHKKLTPAQKAKAKSQAKRAGRAYPNLVDNMRVAADSSRRSKT